MFQNWIQRDISGRMGTRSSTSTQAILSKIGGKGTRKRPPRQKIWEGAHQTKNGSQVNGR